ncbi:unnamed protein product, partial [Polarella glacialis]
SCVQRVACHRPVPSRAAAVARQLRAAPAPATPGPGPEAGLLGLPVASLAGAIAVARWRAMAESRCIHGRGRIARGRQLRAVAESQVEWEWNVDTKDDSRTTRLPKGFADLNAAAEAGNVVVAERVASTIGPSVPAKYRRMFYNTIIKACANAANPERANHWFQTLLAEGLEPNQESYGKLMEASAKAGSDQLS